MIVSGHEMHLYCDVDSTDGMPCQKIHEGREGCSQFSGNTHGECKRNAISDGWRFHKGKVICPKCRKAKRKINQEGNADGR